MGGEYGGQESLQKETVTSWKRRVKVNRLGGGGENGLSWGGVTAAQSGE